MHQADDRIAEEAACWVARLQSADATEQDRHEFQAWLGRDVAHQAAYDEFKELWAELKDVPIPSNRLRKLRISRRAVVKNVVALGIVAMLSATLYQMGFVDRMRADHYTAVGEVRSFTLSDGSRVDLNTDSAIAIHYSRTERRIELLRGEAFFAVIRDRERPFVVKDISLEARALGTQYGVRAQSGDSLGDVRVEQGQVEVTGDRDRVVLEAGDVARLTAQGRLAVTKADIANDTAWRSGKLVFSGQPLRDVLATLDRYRRGRIVILDNTAAEQRVSGIFDLNDTDQALRVLEESLPVSVTHLTGLMVVVRSR
ncbi:MULTISPECIES: FecR family protein [unclassified Bradyrhizobium]|uniref:FecR family protein n=1 Tax=unclassified Bradyrhizobium TaxID=2631580 RepID=UPI002FF22F13